jgi:ribosomal protein S18 acetylase RimI-like enzyme
MNKNCNFEKLNIDDLNIIMKIAKNIILNIYSTFLDSDIVYDFVNSEDFDKEYLENIDNMYVMKLKEEIIGFSIIIDNKIHLIMIDIQYQGKNHGKYLLEYMENILFESYSIIELQSFKDNRRANLFYEKNGWKMIEEIENNGIIFLKYLKRKEEYRTCRNVT